MLCVSIHDVAPATWHECARLAQAIRSVGDVALSWLVVPHYHQGARVAANEGEDKAMRAGLDAACARGDELVLHGYTHLDTERPAAGLRERFLRGVYTRSEGEFSALSAAEARHRIELGLAWFCDRGWQSPGFVAPAWLLGQGAWEALPDFGFAYTTTFSRFHLLREGRSVLSPSLVYTARNRAGRAFSPVAASLAAPLLARAPLMRLSLHPPDVRHPRLLSHAQQLVERLLDTHEAVTKAACAERLSLAQRQPRPQ
jgi:predicted deacetylase